MTNRPRRSRPSRSQGKTIEHEAANPASTDGEPQTNVAAQPKPASEAGASVPKTPRARAQAGPSAGQPSKKTAAAPMGEALLPKDRSMAGPSPAGVAAAHGRTGAYPEGPPRAALAGGSGDGVQPGLIGGGFAIPSGGAGAATSTTAGEGAGGGAAAARNSTAGATRSKNPPPARSSLLGATLAAGVVGAVLALGGVTILQAYNLLPSFAPAEDGQNVTRDDLSALVAEVEAIQRQVETSTTTPADDTEITSGLAGVRERLDALEAGARPSAEDLLAGENLQASAEDAGRVAATAQQTADAASQTATAAQQAAEEASQAAQTGQQGAAEARQIAETAQQAAEAAQQAADEAQRSADAAGQMANQTAQSISAVGDQIAALDERIGGIEDGIAQLNAANDRATRALAAANLKSAIDSGQPFMDQLETYASAPGSEAGGSEPVQRLREFAPEGVPTSQALLAQWPDVQDRIAEAIGPDPSGEPVGDRFLSSLRSLVEVRPAGRVPADAQGPGATLQRMDQAISSGDLAAWRAHWQELPDDAQSASSDFERAVSARIAANEVVSGALNDAIGSGGASDAGAGTGGEANQG